ncbi:CPBP family intramembrane metalloprotease [Candidatus Acetothermia bacterium]|nr:CPBP family intramembrane metalloprotease [Candidatus Acetothermia bacterium]MBI3643024.1 CPBP family intramembrane metalloprotease [Candidatus Acetothermia bacterium]
MHDPEVDRLATPEASHATGFFISMIFVLIFGLGLVGLFLTGIGVSVEGQLFTAIGTTAQALLIIGLVLFFIRLKKFDLKNTLRLRACPAKFYLWGVLAIVPLGILVAQLSQILVQFFPGLVSDNMISLVQSSVFTGDLPVYLFFALAISVGAGISEELAFRGFILKGLESAVRPPAAIALTALVFALFHFEPLQILEVFPAGLFLGYLAVKSNSIFPAIAAHAFNNLYALFEVNFWQTEQPNITPKEILLSTGYPIWVLILAAGILILAIFNLMQPGGIRPDEKNISG